ncbi:biofilm peroxide resistance protein BsmA [Edwardsiella piscicida]|uniref:biofilm peroxide resistance protein BsmA n=1 Tax=Edwardsiella piscicida TaxID=1263550 RepID=UPI0009321E2C|nr:biofilm peroxide resistance protein BsmA [Edwardsiella piscicida]
MKTCKLTLTLLLTLLLGACSVMDGKPMPPPIAGHAQEVRRNQTEGLSKMWNISASVYGSPMNVQEVIQQRADAAGARYYYIVMLQETGVPGQWYSVATLYR